MRRFLVEKGKRFKIQDFTLSHWSAIDAIGNAKQTAGSDAAAKKLTLWPVSLTDFLDRKLSQHLVMRAYLLDPMKLADPVEGVAKPQLLPPGALPLDGDPLQGLIRVREISAQRGLGETDSTDSDGA